MARCWLLGIAQNKLRESVRRGQVDHRARERLGMGPLLLDDDDLARVLGDRGYRELAAELGCSEQVVRQHVSRGLKRLRALMKEQA